ncbi:MAG TPA: hypothetical protein VFG68_21875, partial [Fimbriiglobus sp.]|nr:hypothetical protein [Fimbriiglobus sp.]
LAASAGADKTVRLWNAQSGAQVRSLAAGSPAFAVALDPAGKRVAAGCADGLVRVWEAGGRHLLTLWSGSDGRWLALTPEGYYAASDGLVAAKDWRAGGSAAGPAIEALNAPKLVAKAARGEKLPEPRFPANPER